MKEQKSIKFDICSCNIDLGEGESKTAQKLKIKYAKTQDDAIDAFRYSLGIYD